MENKYFIKNCTLIPTEGSSLSEEFEISAGNPSITYYESLKSPSISLSLQFIDVDQLISREGITGGEYLDLIIQTPNYEDFVISPDKHFLMLNSVKDVKTSSSKQVATLEFVSVESIVNETSRVSKRFSGNVSDLVAELLIGDKRGIKTSKNLDKDQAFNKYSFIGNMKRPFDTIQWLCPKAATDDKNCGFLFYETLDGYFFKSIQNLLDADATVYEKPEKPVDSDFRIIENNLDSSNDIGMNCRLGMYANKTIYVDLETGTTKTTDYKISEIGLKKPPKLPNGLEDFPTRLMLRLLDKGAMQKGSKKDEKEKETELAIFQNKAYARNNLLFSQSLSISVPFNPDMRAGQMIEVKLPVKKSGEQEQTDYGSERDNDISGRYLVSELKHNIANRKANTQLKLIRDVFTA
tara:strand:+ start:2697 stop:3920 length:1224 start_codon:yes stop_codon:yes gene_type:complete